jgi:hypothetical protein
MSEEKERVENFGMRENVIERRSIVKAREKRNYQVKEVLGKLNLQEKKAQMTERREISLWLNTKLIELERKHSDNKRSGKK